MAMARPLPETAGTSSSVSSGANMNEPLVSAEYPGLQGTHRLRLILAQLNSPRTQEDDDEPS